MPLINNSVYFIHIPRTGGRFIRELFYENNYNLNFDNFNNIKTKNGDKELTHLAYPEYTRLFNKTDIKCFAVIRDPLTRFKSFLKDKRLDLEKIFYNKYSFLEFVNDQIMLNNSNWYLPQVNFITKNTFLWKYEKGLNKGFFDWLHKNFGFTFEKTNVDYEVSNDYDDSKVNLDKKQIEFIKEYYYQDYKILEY
tara:strand:- start:54 stop:635 length:582 start_codon:yes stop_codon:yes gene_type:complete